MFADGPLVVKTSCYCEKGISHNSEQAGLMEFVSTVVIKIIDSAWRRGHVVMVMQATFGVVNADGSGHQDPTIDRYTFCELEPINLPSSTLI